MIGKQRARMQRVYQRAKANEMAMRTLLPNEATIECPCFLLSEQSLDPPSPSPVRRSHHTTVKPHPSLVLPPLVHPDGHVTPITQGSSTNIPPVAHTSDRRDSNTSLRDSINKRKDSKSRSVEDKPLLHKPLLHPLSSQNVAASDTLPVSGMKLSSKPVCVPLTMSELLQTTPINLKVTDGYSYTCSCMA